MPKFSGVDSADISGFSGKSFVESSGLSYAPATTDTGVVVCPYNLAPYGPFSAAEASSYTNPINMLQVSTITGVQKLAAGQYNYAALKTNGDLYIGGWNLANAMGLNSTDGNDVINNGGMLLTLTGVSKVAGHSGGMWAIKTDGTLWWCGNISFYLDNTGHGQTTSNSQYKWSQVGSDTDWVDIASDWNYPYTAIAIKGSTGSQYLYSCGYNTAYGTGLGTVSGQTKQWTRVKSDASTNLAESFSEIAINYSSCLAVTEGGELFSWGENLYGSLGSGNTTDKPYATQVGSDTDWDKVWVSRFGGFAMKTNGTMYMTTGTSQWRIEPSTTKTFTQIGTDTDYEDLALYEGGNTLNNIVFAKKNGVWYVSSGGTNKAGSWVGDTAQSATTQGSWVSLSSYMENPPTGTIDALYPMISNSSPTEPSLMFALS